MSKDTGIVSDRNLLGGNDGKSNLNWFRPPKEFIYPWNLKVQGINGV